MSETVNRGYQLLDPEAQQRVGALRIIAAVTAVDVDVGAILAALADKLDTVDLAPAISAAIDALVGAAPGALDTLYEIATKVTETDGELDGLLSVLASKADAAAVTAALGFKADTATVDASFTTVNNAITDARTAGRRRVNAALLIL